MPDKADTAELVDAGADLAAVAAALRDLTAALTPALTPATRPTWDQQRWAPTADAFGPDHLEARDAPVAAAVLPSGLPGNVVANELIESAWGNAVAGSLLSIINNHHDAQQVTPGGNADGGGGPAPAVWLTSGVFVPPPWATAALVAVTVTGAYAFAAYGNTFGLAVQLGAQASGAVQFSDMSANRMPSITVAGAFNLPTPPTPFTLNAVLNRVAGTGAMRADAGSAVLFSVDYRAK